MTESYKNPLSIKTTVDYRGEPNMVELFPADGPDSEVGFNLNFYDVEVIFTPKFRPGYYLYTHEAGDKSQPPLDERQLNYYKTPPWEKSSQFAEVKTQGNWTRVEVYRD